MYKYVVILRDIKKDTVRSAKETPHAGSRNKVTLYKKSAGSKNKVTLYKKSAGSRNKVTLHKKSCE